MPEISGYTPPWLSRPSPGSRAFTNSLDGDSASKAPSHSPSLVHDGDHKQYYGPHRLLARRGTEVFVVVQNQIRWLDLQMVKNTWEEEEEGEKEEENSAGRGDDPQKDGSQDSPYRILVAPIYHQIRQLIISPSGHFLAILTEHTVHIAILPDSPHLAVKDRSSLKLKTHQLGPTIHVLPQSPIVAALWHPLACSTTALDCLVTVTVEAAVRMWEIDRNDAWSFDRPSLAIDLQKLADGTSCDQDFEPSGFGKTKGFSVDSFEMEVTAACFGGNGREEENGWAPMTLWTAMRNGDIYALCPILPQQWIPTSTLIPSLSTSVVANMACVQDDSVSLDEKCAAQQQFEWVQDIDDEEPLAPHSDLGGSLDREIRILPAALSTIPRLQGPFLFDAEENELDLEISDIHVVPAKFNAHDLLSSEEEDYADLEGLVRDRLSTTIICLVTTTGKVHVCLNQETISGQWLPKTGKGAFSVPVGEPKDLVLVDSLQLGEAEVTSENRPLFSYDSSAPYEFYLTSSHRIDHLSLSSWAARLEAELTTPSPLDSGLDFRIRVLCESDILIKAEILDFAKDESWKPSQHLSSALVMYREDLDNLLLTYSSSGAHAVTFETQDDVSLGKSLARAGIDSAPIISRTQLELTDTSPEPVIEPPRAAYEPSAVFYESQTAPLHKFLSESVFQRHRAALKQDISLSPSTLDIMTAAHRILSLQTSQLEQAAAELFRRCLRLGDEIEDQVRRMAELADKFQSAESAVAKDGEDRNTRCEKRITRANDRQLNLKERYEALRRKVGRATAGGKELSNREKSWVREITQIGTDFGYDSEMPVDPPETQSGKSINKRYDTVQDLAESLLGQVQEVEASRTAASASASKSNPPPGSTTTLTPSRIPSPAVPTRVQKAKIEEAMLMVERETAVIEGVMASLDRLNLTHIDQ